MLRRLDRYVFFEVLGPVALGFLVYTFVLLLKVLFRAAELLISSGVPVSQVGRLLGLSLPNIVVLTIPMAFLFGLLIAVGRLASDSELVALRASGISLFSLYRPILLLSMMLGGLNLWLMLDVLPKGNEELSKLTVDIMGQALQQEIQPRIPHARWDHRMLYVFENPPGENEWWRGVVLADSIPGQDNQLTVAGRGRLRPSREEGKMVLTLEGATNHRVSFASPDRYNTIQHEAIDFVLETASVPRAASSIKKSLRSQTLAELRVSAGDPNAPPFSRNLARVEIHKKFGIPAACLVFGLLGLPLGFSNSRGGKSSGFAISLGIILVYYVLLNWGEEMASNGTVPAWLAVWLPNVALLSAGLFLLARRNRDKSLLLTALDRWIQEHLWRHLLHIRDRRDERREARRTSEMRVRRIRSPGGADLVLRLPTFRVRFPNSIDRYVLRTFLRVFLLAALSGLTLYIVADISDNADEIIKNQVQRDVVLEYYELKSLSILYEISPIIALVTVLIGFGLLARTNEITAMKALGISLYRLAVPVVLAASAYATVQAYLQAELLASSGERITELEAQIKGRSPRQVRRADQRWIFGQDAEGAGGYLYNFARWDPTRDELHQLQVFRFDGDYRMTSRLFTEQARHVGDGWWLLSRGWTRGFGDEETYEPFTAPRKVQLPEDPEFFEGETRAPQLMGYRELRAYIDELRSIGAQDVPELEVALHNKIAYPVLSLVMALVALPFAFRLGRKGALYGIGLSLGLGFVLLIVLAFFSALGENGFLPPPVAVWSPSVIFSIFSLYLFLGVRS